MSFDSVTSDIKRVKLILKQRQESKPYKVRAVSFDNAAFERDQFTRFKRPSNVLDVDHDDWWDMDDHKIPLQDLCFRYQTDPVKGLKGSQVDKNREQYGRNVLDQKGRSKIWPFAKALFGGLNSLLWVCVLSSFVSYGVQHFLTPHDLTNDNLYLGITLIVIVHISGSFSFYQEYKSQKILKTLSSLFKKRVMVHRNGKREEVAMDDIVVGDVVDLSYGDIIPADIRLIESKDFKVDNSSLTGESDPQRKSAECSHPNSPMDTENLVFFSTNAIEGTAKGIVVRTGSQTVMGRLAISVTNVDPGPSALGTEIERVIKIMVARSLTFGLMFMGIAIYMGYTWTTTVFFFIGIIVANMPEGLAVAFDIVLIVTARRMADKNCLVKFLPAVEALGSTSVICTDKTGTLTQNRMSVSHLWYNNDIVQISTSELPEDESFQPHIDRDDPGFKALANVAILCSRAIFKPRQYDVPIVKKVVEGDATESAILRCMESLVGNIAKKRKEFPKIFEMPFNSRTKFQVSVHSMAHTDDPRYLVIMKGAPEIIIKLCTTIFIKGEEVALNQWKLEEFHDAYMMLGEYGEHVLGFADCRLPLDRYPEDYVFQHEKPDFLNGGLRFVGLLSMLDPPRAAVPNAVSKCRQAGIKVVMVTGDHPVSAAAIGRAVGIISEGNQTIEEIAMRRNCSIEDVDPKEAKVALITGSELNLLTSAELRSVLSSHAEIVFARASPEQKYEIVSAFQELGHMVAATGDGVNDSPALKKADIGVAMGIAGTEVSKEAADLILLNDDFTSIITGVAEGRLIFENLKKLISYGLPDNIAEMYSLCMFIILQMPLPIGPMAMLLLVLISDLIPSATIAYEPPEIDIMQLKPRDPKLHKLVTRQLLEYAYGQAAWFQCSAGFLSYFITYGLHGWYPAKLIHIANKWESKAINDLVDSHGQEWSYNARQELKLTAQTAFFSAIVVMQIANLICCKTRRLSAFTKNTVTNWRMNVAVVAELCLAFFFVYTPFLRNAIKLRYLPPILWLPPIPFALLMILMSEVHKFSLRKGRQWSIWLYDDVYL